MAKPAGTYTPMMAQFLSIKQQYPDVLLLYRMGDFYETFFDDAKIASQELELTLTSRDGGANGERIPMAGVPHHALDTYLPRLIAKGYRVAICEQMEDPALAKGLVRREVVRLVTPGTLLESSMLHEKQNNFLASLVPGDKAYGLAYCDISTGEFRVTQLPDAAAARQELDRLVVAECLVPVGPDQWLSAPNQRLDPATLAPDLADALPPGLMVTPRAQHAFESTATRRALLEQFGVQTLEGFGCEHLPMATRAAGAIINYLSETQRARLPLFSGLKTYQVTSHMVLDGQTRRNLELTNTSRDGSYKGSLLSVLDGTRTAMGGRRLRQWLLNPLLDPAAIAERQDAIAELLAQPALLRGLADRLASVRDIERLAGRVAAGTANARDLNALKDSLLVLPHVATLVARCTSAPLKALASAPGELVAIATEIEATLADAPPIQTTEGNVIRAGHHPEVDELRALMGDSKDWLAAFEAREKERSGIKSLKVGFSKTFGYFIEVTHANRANVPADYHRKQTLVNAERYITPELKDREAAILQGEDKLFRLEHELFVALRAKVGTLVPLLQETGGLLANLDVLANLAELAQQKRWVRPALGLDTRLEVQAGRHPVVEELLPAGRFVPNDARMDTGDERLIILTGPNMAGKCLAGDTLIFSDRGLQRIRDLMPEGARQEAFTATSFQVRGMVGNGEATQFYVGGRKPTVVVTTRTGFRIEGTADHKVWIRDSQGIETWKRLGELEHGDVVAIERRLDLWGDKVAIDVQVSPLPKRAKRYALPNVLDPDLAYIMGLMVGDGTMTYRNSLYLTTVDGFIADEFVRVVAEKFAAPCRSKQDGRTWYVSSLQIREFFAALDLGYVTAAQKHVPRPIMEAPREVVAAFLQGLFDTDGHAGLRDGNVQLATASERLAREVQLLLLNFGILSSVHTRQTSKLPSHQVCISGDEAIRFHQVVGFRLPRKRERALLASGVRMPNVGGIPHLADTLKVVQQRIVATKDKPRALKRNKLVADCEANAVPCQELLAIQSSRYFYDRVAAIDASEAEVYDFNVEPDHAYVAAGFLSHNSTYMRQTALIIVLAQIGSFVPADSAHIGLVDRIFTRIGAVDDLSTGQSTFMVEMNETANILNNATERSFILLDEIGRGTSTFDGLSIAWAVAEHLAQNVMARTVFATHYHELTSLALSQAGVRNYRVMVEETEDDVVFLRRVVPGGADRSYGIEVARLAGLPPTVVGRAKQVLAALERNNKLASSLRKTLQTEVAAGAQMSLFGSSENPDDVQPSPMGHRDPI